MQHVFIFRFIRRYRLGAANEHVNSFLVFPNLETAARFNAEKLQFGLKAVI